MLTLLGSLLGLFGSFVPEAFKYVRDISDKRHELAILDRQMALLKLKHHQGLEELETMRDANQMQAIYQHARPVKIAWVDALSGSVRPMITYVFFLLYGGVKVALFHQAHMHMDMTQALPLIWQADDQALFAAVMSFWFGQRALLKFRVRG